MARRRRLYIPIARSGSSMLASLITQLIEAARKERYAKIDQRLARQEITPGHAFFLKHPILCLMLVWLIPFLIFVIASAFIGRP